MRDPDRAQWSPDPSEVRWVEDLVAAFPVLADLARQHVDDHGELLPHLFCGDLTRWLLASYGRADSEEHRDVVRVLAFVEDSFSQRPEVQNLIAVSILENFPRSGDPNDGIRTLLGSTTSEELESVNPS